MNLPKKIFALLFLCAFTNYFSQDSSLARKDIDFLTSKVCWGRGYTNKGLEKAAEYLNKSFKTIGLKPLNKKKYSQFLYMNVNTFPGKMEVIADGKKLIPGVHFIVDNESKGISGGFMLFKKDSVTYHAADARSTVPLIISLQKKLTWSASQKVSEGTIIELLKDSFQKEIKNMDVQIETKFVKNYKMQNICGFIPGTEKKDSFIVFTAHYDHLGGMGSTTFFPGANDNASGVSLVLQLARYYKLNPPKYNVAFLLFCGEEAGLVGSKYFTENPLMPLSKIKFLVNLDLLGTGDEGITVVNATEFKKEFDLLKSINDEKKLLSLVKPRGKAQNSDHFYFGQKGVHCFFIYTMGGIKAYHDVYDISKTLPLTKYKEVFLLLTEFVARF
ncbi:MAG: M28 family peptidase [Bacteroidia bacterium]|nr:M28 family peptidase [Bacteroidia bacterium]